MTNYLILVSSKLSDYKIENTAHSIKYIYMIVADYVTKFLKSKKIKEIFMLTGYGSMYLNDSIKKEKIKYFATRNEATAPIMAASYARVTNNVGVACVTAGPRATYERNKSFYNAF